MSQPQNNGEHFGLLSLIVQDAKRGFLPQGLVEPHRESVAEAVHKAVARFGGMSVLTVEWGSAATLDIEVAVEAESISEVRERLGQVGESVARAVKRSLDEAVGQPVRVAVLSASPVVGPRKG